MIAYEVCFIDSFKNIPFKNYGVFFGNDKTTIGFYGIAVSHVDKTIQEFKTIAKTIKIK
jgi:hypothetical protein